MANEYLNNSADVLELAALAEAGCRNFYRACAAQWPQDAAFWQDLAADEDVHYRMVNRMVELVKANPQRYRLRAPFPTGAYRSFIDWAGSMSSGVKLGAMTDPEAVDIARTVENTMLESRVQELIDTQEAEYLRLIAQLMEQTRRHYIMVSSRANGLIKVGAHR